MASRPQPFHLARHTPASRACGQFVGRFAPRAATLGRPLPQIQQMSAEKTGRPTASPPPSFFALFSRRLLQQPGSRSGIIVHRPRIHERPIRRLKMCPPAGEPAVDGSGRHVVSPLPDPGCYATQRHARRRQPQKDHLQPVSGGFPPAQAGQMHPTAERRLESELCALGGQPFDFIHEQSARRHGRCRRLQGGKTCREQIRIDEVQDAGIGWKILAGKGGLSGTIGAGNDDATRSMATVIHDGLMIIHRRHASARPAAVVPYHCPFNAVAGRESLRTPPRVTT